jgi:hypothetical protein
MRLFIWNEVKQLKRYGNGQVIAMAENLEPAIEQAVAAYRDFVVDRFSFYDPEEREEMVKQFEIELRAATPFETSRAKAVLLEGSE